MIRKSHVSLSKGISCPKAALTRLWLCKAKCKDGSSKLNRNAPCNISDAQGAANHRKGVVSRRSVLATWFAVTASGLVVGGSSAGATTIDVLEEQKGIGSRGARRGDLLLFHYVGRLEATGQVFDSTRGGLTYRDGGSGVLRPAAVALGGGPVPGICEGLQQALDGLSVGGRRTVRVPAALGFGDKTVLAPYAVVPANSTLVYEVELLRLSAVGPDQLTKGIAKCGAGGANQQSDNCINISYAEFL